MAWSELPFHEISLVHGKPLTSLLLWCKSNYDSKWLTATTFHFLQHQKQKSFLHWAAQLLYVVAVERKKFPDDFQIDSQMIMLNAMIKTEGKFT